MVAVIALAAAPAGGADRLADVFTAPNASYKPKIRWWWTCGEIIRDDVERELREIATAGFGGVEIACMFTPDPRRQGWGSPAMRDRMAAALESGRRHGLEVDFTVGPAWPLVVPGVTPNDRAAAQELAFGSTVLGGGSSYAGVVPPPEPAPAPGVTESTLVAVQAVRCAAACTGDETVRLVAGSTIDLTARVVDGRLAWTAPVGGDWLLLGFWQRGTGQAAVVGPGVTVPAAYVVDHFAEAGARAAIDFWERAILSPEMRELLRETGGDLFEDSLELDSNLHWTWDLLEQFETRRGYSLRPFLPVLMIERLHRQYSSVSLEAAARYAFSPALDRRVRHDYVQTLTDLYAERHAGVLQAFAHELGLAFRAQPYGETVDVAQIASTLDVPETEGLATDLGVPALARLQDYRVLASAAHAAGVPRVSTECCAVLNAAYAQTWQDLLARISASFVGGVNQIVVHGFAYERGLGAPWPGFSVFTLLNGNGFSEAWGPRQPTWDDVPRITRWLSRMQLVLRQGSPRVDVAVYRQHLDRAPGGLFTDPGLARAGFTFGYLAPSHTALESARVASGRLAPDGPAYRALVLNEAGTLPLDAARRILSFARSGLPVVVAGALPSTTPGAARAVANDAALAAIVGELLDEPTVRRVRAEADVPSALAALGVEPALRPLRPTELLSARRSTPEAELYVVHNPTAATVRTTLALEGNGAPYRLDPWTGSIASLARHRRASGRTVLLVTVRPGETIVLAIGDLGELPPADVGSARQVRQAAPRGRDDERTPARRTLAAWRLDVGDWRAGADGTRTTLRHSLRLSQLEPWSEIPELRDVSGIGTYTTTVRLPRSWTRGRHRACLELGEVFDTFRVRVNGVDVGAVDQTTAVVDVSRHLQAGTNTIEVRVATTLRNRLRVTPGFLGQALEERQEYGLVGPVVLRVRSASRSQEGTCR